MLNRRIFEPEHDLFRESVRRFYEAEVAPHREEWREAGQVSREVWARAGEAGFCAMWADERWGGADADDFRLDQILCEELAGESGFFLTLHNRIVAPYLRKFGTDEQLDRFMPGVVAGTTILAIAMTEPGAGSDLAAIRTTAKRVDGGWVLNGSKTYISNGQLCDLVIVAARTGERKIGLFLVENGTNGFRKGRKLKKLGLHSQDTSELFFDDCFVADADVLGDTALGFRAMMVGLAEERLLGACGYLARADRAFGITMDFITERRAFGRPIGQFQNSRFAMASMRTELDAAQAFVDHCVMEHLDDRLSAEMGAQAKLLTSEVEGRVVDQCLQLHGGAGYMDEYEISRLYADARISRIYAGTSEIMREIIGRGLGLDERAPRQTRPDLQVVEKRAS